MAALAAPPSLLFDAQHAASEQRGGASEAAPDRVVRRGRRGRQRRRRRPPRSVDEEFVALSDARAASAAVSEAEAMLEREAVLERERRTHAADHSRREGELTSLRNELEDMHLDVLVAETEARESAFELTAVGARVRADGG